MFAESTHRYRVLVFSGGRPPDPRRPCRKPHPIRQTRGEHCAVALHHRTNPSRIRRCSRTYQWPNRDGQHAGRPQRRRSPASRPTGTRRPRRRSASTWPKATACIAEETASPCLRDTGGRRAEVPLGRATPESGSRPFLACPANSERRGWHHSRPGALCIPRQAQDGPSLAQVDSRAARF
jgi:hypothetical protein